MYLFLSDPRLRGQAVKRVQEMLLHCGYEVGEAGADGVYGKETMRAVTRFQSDNSLHVDGVVGPSTWRELEEETAGCHSESSKTLVPGSIVDISKKHPKPKLYRSGLSPRKWDSIIGVTLHQTGCNLADIESRWYPLNAHIGVLKNGVILIVNGLTDFIWHAQGFSHDTIGIEFNGNFRGVESDNTTWWPAGGEASFLTAAQLIASRSLLRYLIRQFSENGADFRRVYAHRQASGDRRADPGSAIWRRVAKPWMDETGATDGGPNFYYGSGRPIPRQWDIGYLDDY